MALGDSSRPHLDDDDAIATGIADPTATDAPDGPSEADPVVIDTAPEAAPAVTSADEPPEPEVAVEPEPEVVAAPEPEVAVEPEPVAAVEPEPVAAVEPEPEVVVAPEPEVVAAPEAAVEAEVPVAEPESGAEVLAAEPDAQAEAGSEERPTPGAKTPSPPVKIVEGIVTSVSPDEVELTLDDGRPAVISRRNFGADNEDPTTVLSVGDRTFGAKLTREDPKKRVVLSRAWALKLKAWEAITEAASNNTLVSARVVSAGAKGVVVDVGGVRGFVPSSHLELTSVSDLSPYVDQTLELKVLEAEPLRERLVLSRRSLLLKESRRRTQGLLTSLKAGDRARGKVTSITDYGAFVDIGGANGLVHLSELSWHRVRRANDVVALGDEVEVVVLDVKAKKRRISLSIRQTKPDPLSELVVGAVQMGTVTRLVDFGAFVSLGDIEGLVHLSELAEYRVSTPDEVVAPGDEVGVKVLSVDRRRRRVELSIRQAAEYGG